MSSGSTSVRTRLRHLDDPILDGADLVCAWPPSIARRSSMAGPTFRPPRSRLELVGLLEAVARLRPIAQGRAAAAGRNGHHTPARAIRDPLGEPLDGYREVAAELRELSDRLVDALVEARPDADRARRGPRRIPA